MAQVGPWLDELPHALTLFRRDHEAAAVRRMDPLCPVDFWWMPGWIPRRQPQGGEAALTALLTGLVQTHTTD